MSLTFKLLSLAIRTAAKPIGNYIKRQAKEHEGFRRFAVANAQRVHWVDMRMRLGLLHDQEAQQRMHEREQKAAEERKRKAEAPMVRTELEQRKHDEQKAKDEKEGKQEKKKEEPKVKIRPLSEAKAIELGANFFSESFIFFVAAGLIVWDSWRSRRKEQNRRDDVAERLDELEGEVSRLRARYEPQLHTITEKVKPEKKYSWWNPAGWWTRTEPMDGGEMPIGEDRRRTIPGSVPGPDPETAVKPTSAATLKPEDAAKADSKAESTGAATRVASAAQASSKDMPERIASVSGTMKER